MAEVLRFLTDLGWRPPLGAGTDLCGAGEPFAVDRDATVPGPAPAAGVTRTGPAQGTATLERPTRQ